MECICRLPTNIHIYNHLHNGQGCHAEETVTEPIGRYWAIDGYWEWNDMECIKTCVQLHGAKWCKAMQGSDLLGRRSSDAGAPM